jgi:hypothetical protein
VGVRAGYIDGERGELSTDAVTATATATGTGGKTRPAEAGKHDRRRISASARGMPFSEISCSVSPVTGWGVVWEIEHGKEGRA